MLRTNRSGMPRTKRFNCYGLKRLTCTYGPPKTRRRSALSANDVRRFQCACCRVADLDLCFSALTLSGNGCWFGLRLAAFARSVANRHSESLRCTTLTPLIPALIVLIGSLNASGGALSRWLKSCLLLRAESSGTDVLADAERTSSR